MERVELARRLGVSRNRTRSTAATLVASADPADFMARFAEAVADGGPVFLGDPGWTRSEADRAAELMRQADRGNEAARDRGWLMIPSGGTSGPLKFARHDGFTLAAAVNGFVARFGRPQVHAINVLPLHHVSGFMPWMRAVLTGGQFQPWPWKRLEAGERPELSPAPWVISLVPTQLQRLLADAASADWLRRLAVVFVGGGPLWPELAERAAAARVPLAPGYGMTETAAMVAALTPAEFLTGNRSSGRALPHARISVNGDGCVTVTADSVCRGYWPEWNSSAQFTTDDLGELDASGYLRLQGRRDAVIITGGKKVQPAEVEAVLRASGEFSDIVVLGAPDPEWGERVIAFYPAGVCHNPPDTTRAAAPLAPHQRPKRFVPVADWPRNAQGKVNRSHLRALLGEWRNQS